MEKIISEKEYVWESSVDIYRDLESSIEEIIRQKGEEFKGIITVTVEYSDDEPSKDS